MNLGLDYDDTYTKDPATWDAVLQIFRAAGHKVFVTTWRFDKDDMYGNEGAIVRHDLTGKVDGFYFTGRQGKQRFMYAQGIHIDIWIDDNPSAILHTLEGFSR